MKRQVFNVAAAIVALDVASLSAIADDINIDNDLSGTTVVIGDIGSSFQDQITITDSSIASVDSLTLADTVTINNSNLSSIVTLGTGADTFILNGGTLTGQVYGDDGNDTLTINSGTINAEVFGWSGNDTISLAGGTVSYIIGDGSNSSGTITTGNDTILISGGTVSFDVSGRGGDDTIEITSGTILNAVQGDGSDSFGNISSGNDTITVTGGSIGSYVSGGAGTDTISITGGVIGDYVAGGDGADTIAVSGGTVFGIAGDGSLTSSSTTGDDTITISGGTVTHDVRGLNGNDFIEISGGTITGNVDGDGSDFLGAATSGVDTVTVTGGQIDGTITAETVQLYGGIINGDILGLSANTLTIDDSVNTAATLSIADGTTFSGITTIGTISNSTFGSNYVFTGFSSLTSSNSTFGIAAATQTVDELILQNGSTLNVASGSNTVLSHQSGGFGNLSISDSTISFINGQAGDRMEVGNLTFSNATFGTDVNVAAGTADQLIVNGTTSPEGSGTILVNSLDGTLVSGSTVIALSPVVGETAPSAANNTNPNYTIQTTGTAGLNNYALAFGSNDGVYLVATPNASATVGALLPKVAIDSRPPSVVSNEVSNITGDAIDAMMDKSSRAGTQLSPLFGVFASGSAGRTFHDGFDVSSTIDTIDGPSFDANEFSALVSLEYDIAKGFDLSGPINAKAGVFGGYASSDVDVGTSTFLTGLGFGKAGSANNKSGVFGGYGLASYGTNYGLIAATGFLGHTDVVNDVVAATGDYATKGYAVSGSVGRIIPFSDRWRLDMRGSALWTGFYGDNFIDSQNNQIGDSEVSFGAVKLQPGIYGAMKLGNLNLQPFVRGEVAFRFGYQNTAEVSGTDFDFEDSDISASLSIGSSAKLTDRISFKLEGTAKHSGDVSSFYGKAGLKIKLGG